VQAWRTALDSTFIQDLDDDLAPLRAAAIAVKHWLYVFDMDATPPACHVLSPFANSYKVTGSYRDNGSKKGRQITTSAWSPILGKDVLPKELQLSEMYGRNSLAVLTRLNGQYNSQIHWSQQGSVASAALKKMSVSFVKITYAEDTQPKQQSAAASGKKRKKETGQASPVSCINRLHMWLSRCILAAMIICSVMPANTQSAFQQSYCCLVVFDKHFCSFRYL